MIVNGSVAQQDNAKRISFQEDYYSPFSPPNPFTLTQLKENGGEYEESSSELHTDEDMKDYDSNEETMAKKEA